MRRRPLTALLATLLLGSGLTVLAAPSASAADPWRVTTRCTQAGVLKVRLDHDENAAGVERIGSEFRADTATGQQTWDWKTKINGVLFTQGASTTDDSGDLRVQVNRAEAGAPTVTSLSFDATNRATGERCRMTVAVPPVGRPHDTRLEPWYAQGFCTAGTPWQLRVERHLRTNGQEKFSMLLRIPTGVAGQQWSTQGSIDGAWTQRGRGPSPADGIVRGGTSVIGEVGVPLDLGTASVRATSEATGETCRVTITVLPLA